MKIATGLESFATTKRRPLMFAVSALVAGGVAVIATAASAQTITVWSGYPELAPFYEHVAESIKDEFPDLTVKVEAIPIREHERRIALGLTSGSTGPLVLELSGSTAQRYIENELIPPAPENVVSFVADPANFNEFFTNNASYNGALYGVPLYRGQGALFYNTTMFEAAGLDGPPSTMAEYTEFAEKLTQRDGNGNPTVSGWSLRLSGGGQGIAEKFWINLFQYGGSVLEQSEDGKWRANYASEAGRETLKQYLQNVHVLKTVTPEMPADAEAFEREQTAMFIRESWVIGDIAAKAPELAYATAPLPEGSIALPTNLYVAGAEGPEAEAAWNFILATNEPDNLLWMLENVGWLPNRISVDYTPVTSKTPALAAFLDVPADYGFFTLPSIGPIEDVLTRLAAQLTSAFGNASLAEDDAAIDAYLQAAADETNQILAREGILAE